MNNFYIYHYKNTIFNNGTAIAIDRFNLKNYKQKSFNANICAYIYDIKVHHALIDAISCKINQSAQIYFCFKKCTLYRIS